MAAKRRRAPSPVADEAVQDDAPDVLAGEAAPNEGADAFQPAAKATGVAKAKVARAPAALAWMRAGCAVEAVASVPLKAVSHMDARLEAVLLAAAINRLFPVQAAVWDALCGAHPQAHDLCIHAPTGSGKTLAYALPVVQSLTWRVVRRLRALVVVPTHDLAHQARGCRCIDGLWLCTC